MTEGMFLCKYCKKEFAKGKRIKAFSLTNCKKCGYKRMCVFVSLGVER